MTHKLKGARAPHELLKYLLGSVVVIANFLAAPVSYLQWTKRRRDAKGGAHRARCGRARCGDEYAKAVSCYEREFVVTDKVSRLLARLFVAAVVTTSLATTAARAEVVQIVWDSSGRFQQAIEIEPGKIAEVCGRLRKGQAVAWSFRSGAPMDFNIHYHEGSSAVSPAKQHQTASLEGRLEVPTDQDYCWMWQNTSRVKDTLSVVLRRG